MAAARLSSIVASLRRGLQSSPQRSRGVRVQSPPKNRARFATVGGMYCDVQDDNDDFDDTGIDADDVDLEEEDADVGVTRSVASHRSLGPLVVLIFASSPQLCGG